MRIYTGQETSPEDAGAGGPPCDGALTWSAHKMLPPSLEGQLMLG